MGDLPASLEEMQHAIVLWKALADRPGASWSPTLQLADTHTELGDVYIAMKNFPRAAAENDQAIKLYISLRDRGVLAKALYAKIDEMKAQAENCRQSACTVLIN
jgi:tetratricopeptide (TPR) repeat protein